MRLNHFSERTLICAWCGKEFKPHHISQIYCCPAHSREMFFKVRRDKAQAEKEKNRGKIS